MQAKNTAHSYGLVAQCLHWAVAILVLTLFGLGVYMRQLPLENEAEVAYAFNVFSIHKTLGLSVFSLAVLRIVWALTQAHPRPLKKHVQLEVLAAQIVHWLLYGLIIAMPLTGWLQHSATQGLAPIWGPFPQRLGFVPQNEAAELFWGWAHYLTAWAMGGIVVLHIAGALKHALIDRDDTLRRMISQGDQFEEEISDQSPKQVSFSVAAVLAVVFGVALFSTGPAPNAQVESLTQSGTNTSVGNWIVDSDQSQLTIGVIQSGKSVAGNFDAWSANIHYDSAFPETARLSVDIDVTSLDLGGINQPAHSANFLNSSQFPTANFSAEGFDPLDDGSFETSGQLALVGRERPITLAFTLDIQDGVAIASGTTEIIRHDYEIGSDDPMVGNVVTVNFSITAVSNSK